MIITDHPLRYHGCITRDEACNVLGTHDGNYLVRAGLKTPGTYSLSFVYVQALCGYGIVKEFIFDNRFGQKVRHYHLYHDGEYHFVGKKYYF